MPETAVYIPEGPNAALVTMTAAAVNPNPEYIRPLRFLYDNRDPLLDVRAPALIVLRDG